MSYRLLFLLSLFFCNAQVGMTKIQKVSKPKLTVTLSDPKHDQQFNDYAIYAYFNNKQIGHINYGPSKNPYVPEGTWSIKSIRVAHDVLEQGVGFQLFSKAINILINKKVPTINIVVVPRLETLTTETLTNIYLRMLEKISPSLAQKHQ